MPTTTLPRVIPILQEGMTMILRPEYRTRRMCKALRIEGFCTPTSFWCLDVSGDNPLAAPEIVGTRALHKFYDVDGDPYSPGLLMVRTKKPVTAAYPLPHMQVIQEISNL